MTREKNYERGSRGEERTKSFIQQYADTVETSSRYPDLLMNLDGKLYGIECKSLAAVNNGNGGRKGNAILHSTEVAGMNALVEKGIIPCLVVEIRPPSGSSSFSYFFIPWNLVQEKYAKRRPSSLSLTFYWILQNGQNLGVWLLRLKEGLS